MHVCNAAQAVHVSQFPKARSDKKGTGEGLNTTWGLPTVLGMFFPPYSLRKRLL